MVNTRIARVVRKLLVLLAFVVAIAPGPQVFCPSQ